MAVSPRDVLTDEDAVLAEVQAATQQRNVIRRAFNQVDLSSSGSDTVNFIVGERHDGEMEIIPPGGEFPRDFTEKRKVPIHRDKYGEEYSISREAERDGYLDDVRYEMREKANKMARTMESAAFRVLENNFNPEGAIGGATGTFAYNDIVDAEVLLMDDPYNFDPDALFVGAQSMGDLKKSDEFTQATVEGERTVREGFIGNVLGYNVYLSTSGSIGPGEAYLVDTNQYGREGNWEDPNTNGYPEPQKQVDVMQMWAMKGWASVRPEAAAKIES